MYNEIAFGDLHLGKKHKVTYGDPTIWDELAYDSVIDFIIANQPQHVIFTGDVFDSSKPSALDFAQFVTLIAPIPKVTILTGNHDLSMLTEDIAFSYLDSLKNVRLVTANTLSKLDEETFAVGWCDTQAVFEETMAMAIAKAPNNSIIYAHCNRKYWENDNDNSFTDELYDMAKEKNTVIISGHEHQSSISNHFIHLGSVVPQARNQLSEKYVWADSELCKLPVTWSAEEDQTSTLVFLEAEPITPRDGVCYMVKTDKDIKPEDLKLEGKDLTIDIIASFKEAAIKEGFSKELLDAYI